MPSTISYKFGDLVMVPFPFTDQTSVKQRPAVVVSSAAYNSERPDIILMAVTSQIKASATVGEIMIHAWQKAGLSKSSAVKPIITTIEKRLVIRRLGQLSEEVREALKIALFTILSE